MTQPFTTRVVHLGVEVPFTVTSVQGGTSLHADGFDYDDTDRSSFLSATAHDVTSLDLRQSRVSASISLLARTEDGRSLDITLFGVTLADLRAALDIAEAEVAERAERPVRVENWGGKTVCITEVRV